MFPLWHVDEKVEKQVPCNTFLCVLVKGQEAQLLPMNSLVFCGEQRQFYGGLGAEPETLGSNGP